MSKKNVFFVVAGIILCSTSCKAPQKYEKSTGAVEISVPFSEDKYKSDKDFFRAKQSGKSIDLATSKKIALQNAKSELAGNINAVVKRVTDQYTNQRTIEDRQEFENKFEELSRETVNQTISNVRIVEEKVFKESDGKYTHWVVIETSKQAVIDGISSKITKNERLQLDYDKKKFEEVFNTEMEKMSKEQ
jgi:hypothetical protein